MLKVTITGGAGSLGQAFIRYFQEHEQDFQITVVDNNEWAMAALDYPVIKKLMDFGDYDFYDMPQLLIHCAAYKHVNLGEENVDSFIETNIVKTQRLFRRAQRAGTQILFVSTDKAVEPISLYGYTKAIGEKLALAYGGSVCRLGNISLSSGSVIPLWEEQIAKNEPLTITDWKMKRYMISADDAVKQIWNGLMKGKRLIVPEMGKEVSLVDLVSGVLAKHGYMGDRDYEPGFKVIGMRPGEKIREKLKWKGER